MADPTEDFPDIEELTAFLRVVELGSFTRAAARLQVPKSTISRRLTRLEDKLGVRLLERTTRQLRLTDPGQSYYESIAGALETMREAATTARDHHALPRGHLRVTAPVDLGVSMGALLADFTAVYPAVSVDIELTGRQVDLVGEDFDVAVRAASQLRDSTLVARRVMDSEIRYYASAEYLRRRPAPRQVADLANHDCLLFRANANRDRWLLWRNDAGDEAPEQVEVSGRMASNDFHFLLTAVRAHAGVAPLPSNTVIEDIATGRLKRVLPEHRGTRAGLFLVYPSARRLPAKARVFIDFASEWLQRELRERDPEPLTAVNTARDQ